MPPRKELDAAASVPAFYGAELRWKREQAGLTLLELTEGIFYSVAYLSQIEMGERRMPLDLARHADRVLGTDGFFERRCDDARKARRGGHAEYFVNVVEMEQHAQTIEEWAPSLLPGLLQTDAYARSVIRASQPREPQAQVEAKVEARLARAHIFEEPEAPEYWAILHEALLRQPIAGPDVMGEQFEHIIDVAERSRMVLQVLPWNVGAHPFMIGTATFLTFSDAPSVMYTEGLFHGQLLDDPGLVKRYARSYDLLRAAALSPKASLQMIKAVVRDCDDDRKR